MNKIEDYLHLYLGCEVIDSFTGLKGIMREVTLYSYRVEGSEGYWTKKTAKPILRPLSSMAEEEAIELAKLSEWEPHFRDVKAERNKYNDWIVTWQGSNESREVFNATGECFYCPEQFIWLLKNGFDLFELSESGLAISKNETVKSNPL